MKFVVGFVCFALFAVSAANALDGPNIEKAREMAQLCQVLNGAGTGDPPTQLPEKDKTIPADNGSANWVLDREGADKDNPNPKQYWGFKRYGNRWAAYKKEGGNGNPAYAIVVRGTIYDKESIMQDVLALTSRADQVWFPDKDGVWHDIQLAESGDAAVHIGFAYGLVDVLFHKDQGLVGYLKSLPDGSEIFVTGHSQGAAIATLLHAFLHHSGSTGNQPYGLAGKHFKLRSYFFAQPKPGDWQFAMDFARGIYRPNDDEYAYVINNPNDWVPQVPLSIEWPSEALQSIVGSLKPDTNDPHLNRSIRAAQFFTASASTIRQTLADFLRASQTIRDYVHGASGKLDEVAQKLGNIFGSGAPLQEKFKDAVSALQGAASDLKNGRVERFDDLDPVYFTAGGIQDRPEQEIPAGNSNTYVPVGVLVSLPLCSKRSSDDPLLEHHLSTYLDLMSPQNQKNPETLNSGCVFSH